MKQLHKEIRSVLRESENHCIDQEELIQRVTSNSPFSEKEVLSALKTLMRGGVISYTMDMDIDGHGKSHTEGIITITESELEKQLPLKDSPA